MNMVDELVAALDERRETTGEKWDLYRCHDGRWIVNMNNGGNGDPFARSVFGATIADVLTAAVESVRLPVVPPRPRVQLRSEFTIEKLANGKWGVLYRGLPCVTSPTKKAAGFFADRLATAAVDAAERWDAEYGPLVATGIEGVDYRMAPS